MRGRVDNQLFRRIDASEQFRSLIQAASDEVEKLSEERILNTDAEKLIEYFVEKYHIEVPTLNTAETAATENERNVDVYDNWDKRWVSVPGVAFDFEIPYSGDGAIFGMRPSTWDSLPPDGSVRGNLICFTIAGRDLTSEAIKAQMDRTTTSINKYLQWHREMWRTFDEQLAQQVRSSLDRRRERLLKQKSLASGLTQIGVKLKEKPGDARTFVPPTVKQKIAPQLPPMRAAVQPEPTLDQGQYETILSLVRGAGRSIEQSSSRTRALDEETLRDMLLVPLNAHFGNASGEAFNFTGKTDILIRHENANLFVAECKIWHGEKEFLAAIDQLLGYLTWRDTKAALVVFSRNRGFTDVVEKMRQLPKNHGSFAGGPTQLDETSFQFQLRLPNDDARLSIVTVMAFDLGSAPTL